jgi:S1-C subfamily serine protease
VLFSQLAPAAIAPPAVVSPVVAPLGAAPAAPSSGAAKPAVASGAPPPGGVASPFGPMVMPSLPSTPATEAGLPMRDLIAKMRADANAQIQEEDKRLADMRARSERGDDDAALRPGAPT